MSKQKVSITNQSIKNTVTNDVKKAICEFIWNGFDANANNVRISYTANELGGISSLSIEDDGDGISRSTLNETFGRYQDSIKQQSFQWSSQVKGHKGKGRYSFNCFSTCAHWKTVCEEDGKLLQHSISIDSNDNDHFNDHSEDADKKVVHDVPTGTIVTFDNIELSKEFFESADFLDYLRREYAVFLKLNSSSDKSIFINGKKLDYDLIISDSDTTTIHVIDEKNDNTDYCFDLTFIRWHEKMKENYSSYFLDHQGIEHFEKTTTLNKKDTGFHHSVYVVSSYFDSFYPSTNAHDTEFQEENSEIEQQQIDFGEGRRRTEKDKVFKELVKQITTWIIGKQKQYINEVASEELWTKFENNGTVVKPKNEYEQLLFDDLKRTVKGIYSVQPKVFINISTEQAKTLVGCINLLLQTDKREDLVTIIDSVVKMTEAERHQLANLLQATDLAHITSTINLLTNRVRTVSAIKKMLYDKSLKAYEVDDVQSLISKAFWLFGEEYNIVTEAEPDFQQALEQYLQKINKTTKGVGKSRDSVEKLKNPDANKEMDIFAFRQTKDSNRIENLIIELKRPSVKLGELEMSQIKTYMRTILSEPQFNSTNAKWTFILVGNGFDKSGSIEAEIDSNKTWGKKDLILHNDKNNQYYEIYVKTWSTIFDDFEMRHDFLLKKLQLKRQVLSAQYSTKQDLHDIVDAASENNDEQ